VSPRRRPVFGERGVDRNPRLPVRLVPKMGAIPTFPNCNNPSALGIESGGLAGNIDELVARRAIRVFCHLVLRFLPHRGSREARAARSSIALTTTVSCSQSANATEKFPALRGRRLRDRKYGRQAVAVRRLLRSGAVIATERNSARHASGRSTEGARIRADSEWVLRVEGANV